MTAVVAFPAAQLPPADRTLCCCPTCQRLDRRFPAEGWQLRLPFPPPDNVIRLGERP